MFININGAVNWNISHIGLWQLCAPLRDSNHLTNQPQAAPLSPAVPRSPLFMISRIFSAQLSNGIDLSWILVSFWSMAPWSS